MNSKPRTWFKRLLVALLGLLLVLALGLSAALLLLDDEDYRALSVWFAKEYFNVTLTIDGALSVELGPTLGVRATGLEALSDDGHVSASISELGIQLSLRPLLSRTVWIDNMTIYGARFDVRQPTDRPVRDAKDRRAIPRVIVQEARLFDIALTYRTADAEVRNGYIERLLIDDPVDEGSIVVDGRGNIDDQAIELAGTLGTRQQLVDPATPFPLDLNLTSDALELTLAGTVADPLQGRGIDLRMHAEDPDLATSLELIGQQTPPLGALRVDARLSGDYDALRVTQMTLSLRRDEQFAVEIEGEIGDLQRVSGLDLAFRGIVDDADIWQWLAADRLAGLERQALRFDATLASRADQGADSDGVAVELDLRFGISSIQLVGDIADLLDMRGLDLRLNIDAPDLAATLATPDHQLPALGALQMHAAVAGDLGAIRFEDVSLSLRHGDRLSVNVTGSILGVRDLDGVALAVDANIDDQKVWQWLTRGRLPGFDRGHFRGSVIGQTGALRFSELDIGTTSSSGLTLGAKGAASLEVTDRAPGEPDVELTVNLSAPDSSLLSPLAGQTLPKLGPVAVTTRLTGRSPQLAFDALNGTIGDRTSHYVTLRGGHGRLDLHAATTVQQAELPMTVSTPRPDRLLGLVGVTAPQLGPAESKATLRIDGPLVRLDELNARIQPGRGKTHRLAGTVSHRVGQRTSAELEFDLDTGRVLAMMTGGNSGELGRIVGRIDLLRDKDTWRVRELQLDAQQTGLIELSISSSDVGRNAGARPEMAFRLRANDPPKLFETAGLAPLALPRISADGTLNADAARYRYRGSMAIGDTVTTVNLSAEYRRDRPFVHGRIDTPLLRLADMGMSIDASRGPGGADEQPETDEKQPPDAGTGTLFGRDPLGLDWLHAVDLDIGVQIGELRGTDLEIDALNGQITLESGKLRLHQIDLLYFGGKASGSYVIDARNVPGYAIDMKVNDLALADILAEFVPDTIKGGVMDLEFRLQGRGRTPHAIASSLNGTLDMAFEKTAVPSSYIEFLTADIFGWTLGRTTLYEDHSPIDCGVIGVDFNDGVATTRVLLADGPSLTISGNASVDLNREVLDMVILPEQKQAVFAKATPVKLSGGMLKPDVEAIPAKAAATRIGKMVLLPQVFVPLEVLTQGLRLLDRQTSSPGCRQVLGRSVEEGFAFEGAVPNMPR